MTNGEIVAIVILLVLLVGGFAAWVWLGGLQESGKWGVPLAAIHFLDWMVKGVSGSLLTVLTRIGRGPTPG